MIEMSSLVIFIVVIYSLALNYKRCELLHKYNKKVLCIWQETISSNSFVVFNGSVLNVLLTIFLLEYLLNV